jgi:hypothetical protein
MKKEFRSAVHDFRKSVPGRRFRGLHRNSNGAGSLLRSAMSLFSLALIVLGVFFMIVPGPGIPIVLLGLALLAVISRRVADLLDQGEIRLRRLWERLRSP